MLLFDDGKRLEKALGAEAAHVIIEVFEKFGEEQKRELATKGDLREETSAIRADLREETNAVRAELRETELRLQKEIEVVRKEVQQVKYDLLKWQVAGFVGMAAIMAKGFGWLGF